MNNTEPILALSWKQPFATAMLFGKIETRTWKTNYRGLVLICTSKKPYKISIARKNICGDHLFSKMAYAFNRNTVTLDLNGYAIAIGRLVDCRKMKPEDEDKCFVKYREDLFCHVYEDVNQIKPFIWKGKQGWTKVSPEIIQDIKLLYFS